MNDGLFTPSPLLDPPANLAAEQALLGTLFTANQRVLDDCAGLEPEHFADPIHARIFADARAMILAGQVADPLTLKARYENAGVLTEVGGTAYLVRLMTAFVAHNTAVTYAGVIRRHAAQRRQLEIAQELREAAYSDDDPTLSAAAAAAALDAINTGNIATLRTMRDAAASAASRAGAAFRGETGETSLTTGIPSVDALWGGLWPGQLYYLAARSRTGKTPAASQIVRNVAAALLAENPDRPGHVHFFSLEMTADDLATINLASTTRWTADEVRSGSFGDDAAWIEFDRAREALATLPIVIDDDGNLPIAAMASRARAVKRSHRTRLIVIDFLELIGKGREHGGMQLQEWVPFVGYQVKTIAKACGVPVIALRQINKSRDSAADTRPTLADLPYDGGQAADGVFALHRPELTMGDSPPPTTAHTADKRAAADAEWHTRREAARGLVSFGALKRRFGPANLWRDMIFDGPRMLLREREKPPEADMPYMWGDGA